MKDKKLYWPIIFSDKSSKKKTPEADLWETFDLTNENLIECFERGDLEYVDEPYGCNSRVSCPPENKNGCSGCRGAVPNHTETKLLIEQARLKNKFLNLLK